MSAEAVSQSLAGRTAVLVLLPPSWDEVQRFPSPPADLMTALFTGAYPRVHDRQIPAEQRRTDAHVIPWSQVPGVSWATGG